MLQGKSHVTVSGQAGENSTFVQWHVRLLPAKPFECGSSCKQGLDICLENGRENLEAVSRLSQEGLDFS
jgi:hypothetical protein